MCEIFCLKIEGSNRNKLIKKIIYYSDAFAIYKQCLKYRIWERSMYGNKNLKCKTEVYLNNTKDVYRKIIIFQPSSTLLTMLKLIKTNNFIKDLVTVFGFNYNNLKNDVFRTFKDNQICLYDKSCIKDKILESEFGPKFCYYELEEYKVKNCFTK